MSELNEMQLLLLDNLMYYSGSTTTGKTVGAIANEMKNMTPQEIASNFSGGFEGMSPEEIGKIATAITSDEKLSSLVVMSSHNSHSVRATCFVDANGDATVAVRGTGGTYTAWDDNVQGLLDMDTDCQVELSDYVQQLGDMGLRDITITGHSKGGNMAQYATIMHGDLIDHCYSFDGQGFNDQFIDTYGDLILANQDKIVSICGTNDYVNILLNSIAGQTKYISYTDPLNPGAMHSSYNLWEANQGVSTFTDIGQSEIAHQLDVAMDVLARDIANMDNVTAAIIVDLLGAVVAKIIGGKKMTEAEWLDYFEAWLNASEAFGNLSLLERMKLLKIIIFELLKFLAIMNAVRMVESDSLGLVTIDENKKPKASGKNVLIGGISGNGVAAHFEVDYKILSSKARKLSASGNELGSICETINTIANAIDVSGSSNATIKANLKAINKAMKSNQREILKLGEAGVSCSDYYRKTEKQLCKQG